MRVLTLEWLKNQQAYEEFLQLFEKRFGEEANFKEVSTWLHEINKPDWEAWLLSQNTQLTKALLENGADIHVANNWALCLAARHGRTEVVRLLIENGANVSVCNDYAFRLAARHGYTETVKLLLENGANIHVYNDYALRLAVERGHTKTVELLKQFTQQPVS